MPIFESACDTCINTQEWLGKFDEDDPLCQRCGVQMRRLPSRFRVVFTGPLSASKYNNPNLPGADPRQAYLDGHWVTRVRSSKTGKPEREFIDTHEKRRKFMKEEGLVGIEDFGDKVEARASGKWAHAEEPEIPDDPTVQVVRVGG